MPRRKSHRRPGWPSLLNKSRIKIIAEALATGVSHDAAAAFADVHVDTLWTWIRKGKAIARDIREGLKSAESLNKRERLYHDLLRERARARANCEKRLVNAVSTCEQKDAWGSAWLLERGFRKRYGRESSQELRKLDADAQLSELEADVKPARSAAELRKLEAEATVSEAKARLADRQAQTLTNALTVDLGDDDGADLVGDITPDDVAAVTPTDIRGDDA